MYLQKEWKDNPQTNENGYCRGREGTGWRDEIEMSLAVAAIQYYVVIHD